MTVQHGWQPFLTRSTPGWVRSRPRPSAVRPPAWRPRDVVAEPARPSWRSYVRAPEHGWARKVLRLTANPASASIVRGALEEWMGQHRVRPDLVAGIVLAASELVDNASEHAYPAARPGTVTLVAYLHHSHLTLTVRDTGTWRLPPHRLGNRGRGLSMVRALADTMEVDHSGPGTRVEASFHAARLERRGAAGATIRPRSSPSR